MASLVLVTVTIVAAAKQAVDAALITETRCIGILDKEYTTEYGTFRVVSSGLDRRGGNQQLLGQSEHYVTLQSNIRSLQSSCNSQCPIRNEQCAMGNVGVQCPIFPQSSILGKVQSPISSCNVSFLVRNQRVQFVQSFIAFPCNHLQLFPSIFGGFKVPAKIHLYLNPGAPWVPTFVMSCHSCHLGF